jgi:putative PIG3 family NAD(P)H quinone oxidoreductase
MDLPDVMTAVEIASPGGPEVLMPVTRRVPVPDEGELLVRVAAAGVNRPDVLQRRGFYPPPPGASDVPGLEIAGEVVAAGQGLTHLIGTNVCALVAGGGYAEYAVAPAATALPVPDGLQLHEAAALPETLFTVWSNLFERGFAAEGDWALVHGGTSGIGTMAIALCRLFGVKAIVTCGSDDKCAAALGLGAAAAINYRTQDFVEEVQALTSGRGVDVCLDMVGGDYLPRNLSVLAEDGRHVSIATQRGTHAEVDLLSVMRRRLTLTGSTLRPRSLSFKAALAAEIRREVWPFVESGQLRPAIDRTFPLRQAAAAHARMEAGEHLGKIVLTT